MHSAYVCRLLRGSNDALSSEAVKELFDGIARADMKPRVALDVMEGAGSCVHLDRSEAFLDGRGLSLAHNRKFL
jgi:hypothetical protein